MNSPSFYICVYILKIHSCYLILVAVDIPMVFWNIQSSCCTVLVNSRNWSNVSCNSAFWLASVHLLWSISSSSSSMRLSRCCRLLLFAVAAEEGVWYAVVMTTPITTRKNCRVWKWLQNAIASVVVWTFGRVTYHAYCYGCDEIGRASCRERVWHSV